ncbi:MAG: hypothetical protein KF709_02560 [Gemmatimonadaceae bacterium]|nr:hypothetical protein [Gemmatimonadaceae bacterium]
MPDVLFVATDTADPITMQLGTTLHPQNLTGWNCKIILRDIATNTRIDAGVTVVEDAELGLVSRALLPGERVVGKEYYVECEVDIPGRGKRTYPGAGRPRLTIRMDPPATAPVP